MPAHLDVCRQDPVPRGARHWSPTARRRIGLSPYGDGIADARVVSAIAERREAFMMIDLTEGIAVFLCSSSICNLFKMAELEKLKPESVPSDDGVDFIPLCLVLSPFDLVTWARNQVNIFTFSKCESLPRPTNFAPCFCYRLERRDVLVPPDVPLGISQRSAADLFGKNQRVSHVSLSNSWKLWLWQLLLLRPAALRPCLLSGGISNSRLAAIDDVRELIV